MTSLATRPHPVDRGAADLFEDMAKVVGRALCGFPPLGDLVRRACPPRCACGGGNHTSGECICEIGPFDRDGERCWPCWLPHRLQPVHEVVCPGSALRIKFPVANQSLEHRTFIVAATGPDATLAKGAPSTVDVDPMSSGELTAVIRVPATATAGTSINLTLWVRGCQDYVTPVCVIPEGERCGIVAVRRVIDQPDTCHTWRDHFYVSRSCAHPHNDARTRRS